MKIMLTQNRRIIGIALSVLALLLIPLIAMQFSNEVHWSIFDFIIAGALLFGTGLLLNYVSQKIRKKESRTLIFIAILVVLFLIWAELAVGIFGSPLAGS